MRTIKFLLLLSIVTTIFACKDEYPDLEDGIYAKFDTSLGPVVAELYYEETPMTVANFVSLAEGTSEMVDSTYKGKNYYDGIIFHRVIDGFMIQGGDPQGTGSGGPGYKFPDEFNDSLSHTEKGILSMANAGPGTNGSQFFITLGPTPHLDGRHTVFGKVVKGLDVVDSIGKTETNAQDRPTKDVVMNEVRIIRKGKDAKNFDAPKVFANNLKKIEEKEKAEAERMAKMMEGTAEKFAEIKKEADSLDSGLKIYFENDVDSEKPNLGESVLVSYEGYLENGTLFDTSREVVARDYGALNPQKQQMGGYRPMPMTYGPEGRAVAGFKEGLEQMTFGDEAILFIPSYLGWGESGAGGVIPPDADVIFKIKLEPKMDESESQQ